MTKVLAISWKRAAGLSWLAVYGPFIVMATYTLLFVSCSHCKTVAWILLPCAPSLLPVEACWRLLDLSGPTDAIRFALAFIVSMAVIWALACLLRRGRRLRVASVSVALALFSILAFFTLALIRA